MSLKKYLTLEEAADAIGISAKELIALRERQEIRGFADRGTWKFKSEDVEEYQRRRQADSNPDVPMLDDVGDQPTIIRKSVLDEDDVPRGTSDSDVRLIIDPEMDPASDVGGPGLADSDSDVRLIDDEALRRKKKTDSDVRLGSGTADSDSDVRLADSAKKKGSDSDVLLVAPGSKAPTPLPDSDSDVKLVGRSPKDTEADMPKVTIARAMPPKTPAKPGSASVLGDDDLILDDDSGLTLKAGSGISLERLVDSGVSLESGDSGISLVRGDDDDLVTAGSAIHLDGGSGPLSDDSAKTLHDVSDSSMTLKGEDSGISLDLGMSDDDSGISLSTGDSGIALESPADSGISLESHDELNQTIPMMGGSDTDQTHLEVPQLGGDSAYDLRMPGSDEEEGADTSVILFDDEAEVEDHAATMKRKRGSDDAGESFDLEDAGEEVESLDDELEVSEDIEGEDDELDDMDVFDAADDDFDESFSTGESHAEFVAPTRGAAPAPVEQEWGGGTFAGLFLTTAVMSACAMVMYDLIRSMWGWQQEGAVTGQLISLVKDMF